jgi:hypothetical protein
LPGSYNHYLYAIICPILKIFLLLKSLTWRIWQSMAIKQEFQRTFWSQRSYFCLFWISYVNLFCHFTTQIGLNVLLFKHFHQNAHDCFDIYPSLNPFNPVAHSNYRSFWFSARRRVSMWKNIRWTTTYLWFYHQSLGYRNCGNLFRLVWRFLMPSYAGDLTFNKFNFLYSN